MDLKVIARARNGHTDKFGIPRQSREESPICTRIVFEPEYRVAEALRGIEGYSHLWLLWGFSEITNDLTVSPLNGETLDGRGTNDQSQITNDHWSPTVRPPRLGGNKRVGVFATRSPFRPNPIGLSSVRLLGIDKGDLLVSGADLLDGTPIYDLKPYLSFTDCHPDARNGFADETKDYRLEVEWCPSEEVLSRECQIDLNTMPVSTREAIEYILSQDPRPGYQDDPQREYKMDYEGWTVTFVVRDHRVMVKNVEKR